MRTHPRTLATAASVGLAALVLTGTAACSSSTANKASGLASAAVSGTKANAGAFCATAGQTATNTSNVSLVCKAGSDGRDRWAKK